ncbi:MAG TPA: hypothetical protein VNZ22_10145, partial [Bacillota bacterium]|nr:hypothetical protein [Bacillota bacterium]
MKAWICAWCLVSLVALGEQAENGAVANAASFFPIGIYGVNATNDFAELKAAGFNLVVGRAERSYLDAARAAGLKVLASPGTAAGPGFNEKAAAKAVRELDRHPALWAW